MLPKPLIWTCKKLLRPFHVWTRSSCVPVDSSTPTAPARATGPAGAPLLRRSFPRGSVAVASRVSLADSRATASCEPGSRALQRWTSFVKLPRSHQTPRFLPEVRSQSTCKQLRVHLSAESCHAHLLRLSVLCTFRCRKTLLRCDISPKPTAANLQVALCFSLHSDSSSAS
jgi:hypothetical protein